jgi:multidrug efflux system outer membrane protein
MPVIAGNASYTRMTANFGTMPGLVVGNVVIPGDAQATTRNEWTSYNYFNFNIGLVQPIWDFGRTLGRNDGAKAATRVARVSVEVARLDLGFRVVSQYYQALAARQMVEVATRARDMARAQAERSQALYKVGARPKVETVQAEATAQSAEAALLGARDVLAVATGALKALVGIRDAGEIELERPAAPVARTLLASRDEAIAEALASRPERSVAVESIAVAQAAADAAFGEHFPYLSANALVSAAGSQIDAMGYNGAIGVNLSIPIFSGLAAVHGVRAAEARLAAARAGLEEVELAVRSEVDAAMTRVVDAGALLGPMKASAAAAREAMSLADQRYKAGEGSQIEVREAMRALADAEAAVVRGELDLAVAWAALDRALGRKPGLAE